MLPHLSELFLQKADSLGCDHCRSLTQLVFLNLNYSKPKSFEFLHGLTSLRVSDALKTGMRGLNLIRHLSSFETLSVEVTELLMLLFSFISRI